MNGHPPPLYNGQNKIIFFAASLKKLQTYYKNNKSHFDSKNKLKTDSKFKIVTKLFSPSKQGQGVRSQGKVSEVGHTTLSMIEKGPEIMRYQDKLKGLLTIFLKLSSFCNGDVYITGKMDVLGKNVLPRQNGSGTIFLAIYLSNQLSF